MSTQKKRIKILNKLIKKYEKGGELIGQGAYGCLFDQDMICYENEMTVKLPPNTKRYTKVFDDISETDKEWNNSKLIATLDPYYENFVYANERCRISYDELKKDKGFDKCDLPLYINKSNLGALKMIYGGIEYNDYFKLSPSFENFIKSIIPLFEGLVKLNTKNLIHQDIKVNNILFDKQNNRFRYIDYGLLKYSSEIYTNNNLTLLEASVPNVYPLPPEYRIFYNKNRDIKKIEKSIYEFNITNDKTYNQIIEIFISRLDYNLALDNFVKYIKTISNSELSNEMTKYTDKIDVYSLGLTIALLSIYVKHSNVSQKVILYEKFKLLVKMMINPDPRERISPIQALNEIRDISKYI